MLRRLVPVLLVAVLAPAPAAATAQPDPVTHALSRFGIPSDLAADVIATAVSDGVGDTFRYAVPGATPATIDAGYGDIVRYGAAPVRFDGAIGGPAGDGRLPCGQTVDGARYTCAGEPAIAADEQYLLLWMELAGPVPDPLVYESSYAFPILTPGGDPWVANDPFLWDTFQGTDLWLQLVASPGSSYALTASLYTADSFPTPVPTNAVAVVDGPVVAMLVPAAELAPTEPVAAGAAGAGARTVGARTVAAPRAVAAAQAVPCDVDCLMDLIRYGVHSHQHDGTFGREPSDASAVDSAPDTNVEGGRGPDDLARPGGPAIEVTDEPEAAETTGPPTTAPTTTEPTTPPTTAGGTTSDGDDGGSGLVAWVVLVGLGLAGGGIFLGTRQRKKEPPPCTCSITVELDTPDGFGVCCMKPEFTMKPTEGSNEEGEGILDPSRIHLDADVAGEEGWDLFDIFVQATITPQCSGGGEVVVAEATYDWDLTTSDRGVTITCTATAPVRCPGAVEHPEVSATVQSFIPYHEAPCIIAVLVQQVPWYTNSHVDVQIVCGEYNEIFGYFALERNFKSAFGVPGEVVRESTSRANPPVQVKGGFTVTGSIVDQVGPNYRTSKGSEVYKAYWIEPDDCSTCLEVRRFWENLAANPGTYYLLDDNCAVKAYESLAAAGLWPRAYDQEGGEFPPTLPSEVEEVLSTDQGQHGGYTIDTPTTVGGN